MFTNIPLKIDICSKALYDDENISPPPYSKDVFVALLEFSISAVEFSFNQTMYQQKEGLGMGSTLSSILANIFVGFIEKNIFSSPATYNPIFYKRYVDDTFALFLNEEQSNKFFNALNTAASL